jgi:hypothetical protein
VAEDTPRRRHLGPLALAVSVEGLLDVKASEADSKQDAAVEGSVVKIEGASEAVAALVDAITLLAVVMALAVAVIAALANRTAMPLLTPQLDQGLTAVSGVIVTVIVTEVGMSYGLAVAHMMTDLAELSRGRTSIEIGERALTSSLSVIDVNTATVTDLGMTTPGNVGMRAATRIRAKYAVIKSPLIGTTLAVLVGMCCLPVFRIYYSDPSFFSLPFVTKGKQG